VAAARLSWSLSAELSCLRVVLRPQRRTASPIRSLDAGTRRGLPSLGDGREPAQRPRTDPNNLLRTDAYRDCRCAARRAGHRPIVIAIVTAKIGHGNGLKEDHGGHGKQEQTDHSGRGSGEG